MRFGRIIALLAASVLGVALSAAPSMASGELHLVGFAPTNGPADGEGFGLFIRDLGLTLRAPMAGPAHTTGSLGLQVGYDMSLTPVEASASHWTQAVDSPSDLQAVSRIRVRKGLPYSFEIGGQVSYAHDLDLWSVGVEVGWAFIEGFEVVPDFGVRVNVSTLLGSRDLTLVTVGADVMISKGFGLGGLVRLTPFAGYSFTFTHGSSHVLGRFAPGGLSPRTFLLPDQNLIAHRGFVGLRLVASIVSFEVEAALGDVHTITMGVGISL